MAKIVLNDEGTQGQITFGVADDGFAFCALDRDGQVDFLSNVDGDELCRLLDEIKGRVQHRMSEKRRQQAWTGSTAKC